MVVNSSINGIEILSSLLQEQKLPSQVFATQMGKLAVTPLPEVKIWLHVCLQAFTVLG
jgi:hypothetical protein